MDIKKLNLNFRNRSEMAYERLTGESLTPEALQTRTGQIRYFYCVVISSNKDLELDIDQFVDLLDDPDTGDETYAHIVKAYADDMKKRVSNIPRKEGVKKGKK